MPVSDKDLFASVPDNEVINQIYPFCNQGVDNRDLEPLPEYFSDTQRIIGHQPGIARAKLANRQARQASHICAGLAQFLARRHEAGILDDGDLDKVEAALARVFQRIIDRCKYRLGSIYTDIHPDLEPGMVPAWGTLIENVDERYPEAWEYFQTPEGQKLCVTESEWQTMNTAVFYTAADGTKFGWNGNGGAPAYVLNVDERTLRVPDVRGMFPEPIGGPASPGLGKAGGDGIRDFFARLIVHANWFNMPQGITSNNGAVEVLNNVGSLPATGNYQPHTYASSIVSIRPGIVSPVAAVNRVASYGVISCCYLGEPKITAG